MQFFMVSIRKIYIFPKALVPKVRVATQTRVAKGQKMGRAEAIQN